MHAIQLAVVHGKIDICEFCVCHPDGMLVDCVIGFYLSVTGVFHPLVFFGAIGRTLWAIFVWILLNVKKKLRFRRRGKVVERKPVVVNNSLFSSQHPLGNL